MRFVDKRIRERVPNASAAPALVQIGLPYNETECITQLFALSNNIIWDSAMDFFRMLCIKVRAHLSVFYSPVWVEYYYNCNDDEYWLIYSIA